MGPGQPGCFNDLLHRERDITESDVFTHRSIEQKLSWRTTPIERRSHIGSTRLRSMSSINTLPLCGRCRRWMSLVMVLLPEPEAPTMATISPGETSILTLLKTSRPSGRIAKCHLVETDSTVERGWVSSARIEGGFRGSVQNVTQSGDGYTRLLKLLPKLKHSKNRPAYPTASILKATS